MEQHFVEVQTVQKDAREDNVVAMEQQLSTKVHVEVQQDTKVQVMAKTLRRVMEMERWEIKSYSKERCAILDNVTLLEKGIKIANPW